MVQEFKEFIMRGNVMDMAVGVIIGGAFQAIIKSLVDDVIMPIIGAITGGIDFTNMYVSLDGNTYDSYAAAKEAGAAVLGYGAFITAVINFLLMAIVIFLVVKGINKMHKPKEEEPAATKMCPYCKSEIDKEATKCPHCTSALEA
ncbi:MAG: large conductance mechanosensitive channel protein MscL [Lachnospiraceae bacterium]|nr:large conductance mechanosensitive channel protein MscL [Butyrivibrio sp.]MBR0171272.1 large conductance mechanosensitive channel protein MscL [Lachnospiraceae bacterium]